MKKIIKTYGKASPEPPKPEGNKGKRKEREKRNGKKLEGMRKKEKGGTHMLAREEEGVETMKMNTYRMNC